MQNSRGSMRMNTRCNMLRCSTHERLQSQGVGPPRKFARMLLSLLAVLSPRLKMLLIAVAPALKTPGDITQRRGNSMAVSCCPFLFCNP
eukprot:8624312-Pyramimonas_sp.AAC.1